MLLSRRAWTASKSSIYAALDGRLASSSSSSSVLSDAAAAAADILPPTFLCPALVISHRRPKARAAAAAAAAGPSRPRQRVRHSSATAHAESSTLHVVDRAEASSLSAMRPAPPAREDRHQTQLVIDMAQELLSSPPDEESAAMVQAMTQALREALMSFQKHPLRSEANGTAHHLQSAFIAVALCLVHLDTRTQLVKAVQLLEDAQSHLGPIPPALLRHLLDRVHDQGRYWGVLAIADLVRKRSGHLASDEILCAEIRALVALSEWAQVDRLWEVHGIAKRKPQQRLGLAVFELLLHVYAANRVHLARSTDDVLGAMRIHGHDVDAGHWLVILRAEERLQASTDSLSKKPDEEMDAYLHAKPPLAVLHEILGLEAEAHNVRGVLKILRMFRIPTGALSHPSLPPYTEVDTRTYAIVSHMLGALARPALALRFYRLAAALPIHREAAEWRVREQGRITLDRRSRGYGITHLSLQKALWLPAKGPMRSESWELQRAALGVLKGFIWAGRPERALDFACAAMGIPRSLVDGSPVDAFRFGLGHLPSVAPCAPFYSSMLQAASHLPDEDSTRVARAILVDMYSRGLKPNQHIRRGLSHLLVHTIGDDLHAMRRIYRRLLPLSEARTAELSPVARVASLRKWRLFNELTAAAFPDRVLVGRSSAHGRLPPVKPTRRVLGVDESKAKGSSILPREFEASASGHPPHSPHSWVVEHSLAPGPEPYAGWTSGEGQPSDAERTQGAREVWDAIMFEGKGQQRPDAGGYLAQELRMPLTRSGYALRLRVYATVRGDIASAAAIFRSMDTHGVRPTMAHVAPLIEGLCRLGRTADADAIKKSAREHLGVDPSLRVHMSLLRAHAQSGDAAGVRAELDEMRSAGYEPNDVVRNILEAASVRSSRSRRLAGASARSTEASDYVSGARLFQPPVMRVRALEDAARCSPHSVMTRFKLLLHRGAFKEAQELVRDALRAGLWPNRDLRMAVRRSINWIAKQARWAEAHPETYFASTRDGGGGAGGGVGDAVVASSSSHHSNRERALGDLERAHAMALENRASLRVVHFRGARWGLVRRRREVLGLLDELYEGRLAEEGQREAERRWGV